VHGSLSPDPPGELLVTATRGNTKNLIIGASELRGPIDLEAMAEAIRRTGERFPRLKTRLIEVKEKGRHHLLWDYRSKLEIPFTIGDAGHGDRAGSSLDVLLAYLMPNLEKERNVLGAPPSEVHLVRLAPDHHVLALVVHHVAADAITSTEIAREFVVNYQGIVTGQVPDSSDLPLATSTIRKRAIRKQKTILKDYWFTFRQALIPYEVRPTLPIGSGIPNDDAEYHVKQVLCENDSERIAAEALKWKVPLVDYLVANVATAIGRWNSLRDTKSTTVTAALTVNMKRRFEGMEGPNSSSVLYFRLDAERRKDPKELARFILLRRINQFRNQMDLKYYKAIGKLNNFLRIFPFKTRQHLCHQILQRHQTSFALGFMGVLWPAPTGRKTAIDSCLTSVGDLEVAEVHGVPYKLISRTPLYLTVYFFRQRLNLLMSAAAWLFTKEEAQAFLNLVADLLKPGFENSPPDASWLRPFHEGQANGPSAT
jgi:hypothetical protein